MLVWTGWGILAAIIPIMFLVAASSIVNSFFQSPDYYSENLWPKFVAIAISAVLIWIIGTKLNNKPGRTLIDKKTGQEIEVKPKHTLFFIKMQYWAIIIVVLGILLSVTS